jgi:glutamyl-tRNA reductase
VQHLLPRNVKSITVVNRGQERIGELQTAFPDANIIPATLDQMLPMVGKSHVTFACTGAMEPILYKENLEGAMQRDAMLVDISVPRNIDDKSANQVTLFLLFFLKAFFSTFFPLSPSESEV